MDSSLLDGKLPYPNQNKGPRLLVAIWVLGSISVLVVLLRIYTKLRKTYRLYWDDVLMVIALVSMPELNPGQWLKLTMLVAIWHHVRSNNYNSNPLWTRPTLSLPGPTR